MSVEKMQSPKKKLTVGCVNVTYIAQTEKEQFNKNTTHVYCIEFILFSDFFPIPNNI